MGLGLAIAREVVIAHGGRISAVDRTGYAVTIRVELPRADSWDGESPHLTDPTRFHFRVLVVDHDKERRAQIVKFLSEHDFAVRDTDDVDQGKKFLNEWPPTAILVGVDDSPRAGRDLIRSLRREGPRKLVPILALMRTKEPAQIRTVMDDGATAVLGLPHDEEWLLRLLSSIYPSHF